METTIESPQLSFKERILQVLGSLSLATAALVTPNSAQAQGPNENESKTQSSTQVEGPVRYRSSVELSPEQREQVSAIINLMESEGIPANEAASLIDWAKKLPVKGVKADLIKGEIEDRLNLFYAELHDQEETNIWEEDLENALNEHDVHTLIEVADLLIQYFKENGNVSAGRVQAAEAIVESVEKEHKNRPTEELRRKILALKMLTKNKTALENFNKQSIQGTAQLLIQIDWPNLAEKEGYEFEVHDPCSDEIFTGTVLEDGYYVNENNERKTLQSIVNGAASCSPFQSTFVSQRPGEPLQPRVGEPVEEPEDEPTQEPEKLETGNNEDNSNEFGEFTLGYDHLWAVHIFRGGEIVKGVRPNLGRVFVGIGGGKGDHAGGIELGAGFFNGRQAGVENVPQGAAQWRFIARPYYRGTAYETPVGDARLKLTFGLGLPFSVGNAGPGIGLDFEPRLSIGNDVVGGFVGARAAVEPATGTSRGTNHDGFEKNVGLISVGPQVGLVVNW